MAAKPQKALAIDWKKLDQLLTEASKIDKRPGPEWFTAREYAKQHNITNRGARLRLDKVIKLGLLEVNVIDRTAVYYRIKKV